MAKNTKAHKSAEAAADAAALAVKDAKKLVKSLPKKDGKKLKELVDDAKDASQPSKKKLAAKPRKVEKAAVEATARLEKATAKIEKRVAEKKAAEKVAAKNASVKKAAADTAKPAKKTKKTDAVEAVEPAIEIQDATPVVGEAPVPEAPETEMLDALTVAALRARARAEGRTGYSRLTKAQLILLLSA